MSAYHAAASAAVTALTELTTPAGRCDRRGLLVAALMLLAAQFVQAVAMLAFAVPHDNPLAIATTALVLWFSTTAMAKRLHDMSRSAWRILWAALAIVVWSVIVGLGLVLNFEPAAMEPGASGYWLAVVATMVPVLAMTLWLHLKPGDAGDNAFGPAPGANGFSRWPSAAPLRTVAGEAR